VEINKIGDLGLENIKKKISNNNPIAVIDLVNNIHGIINTQLIFVAAKLGIADLLVGGCNSISELSRATGANENRLLRIMKALVGKGYFSENAPGCFELTEMGEPLLSDYPSSVRDLAIMMGSRWHVYAFGNILEILEGKESGVERAFNLPIFDYLGEHPEDGAIFNALMSNISRRQIASICKAYSFPEKGTIVDVGGGRGGLLAGVLNSNRLLQGVLFDLPVLADEARNYLESEGVLDRCRVESGSFFEGTPSDGDIYVLKNIIHDYDDDDALEILRWCRHFMPPQSRLLVIDIVLSEKRPSFRDSLMDVQMMVVCGGKERTEAEFRALFSKAGLKLNRLIATRSEVSIIEGL